MPFCFFATPLRFQRSTTLFSPTHCSLSAQLEDFDQCLPGGLLNTDLDQEAAWLQASLKSTAFSSLYLSAHIESFDRVFQVFWAVSSRLTLTRKLHGYKLPYPCLQVLLESMEQLSWHLLPFWPGCFNKSSHPSSSHLMSQQRVCLLSLEQGSLTMSSFLPCFVFQLWCRHCCVWYTWS